MIAINTNSIAKIYHYQMQFDAAILNAKKVFKFTNDGDYITDTYQTLGNSYFAKKEFKQAIIYQNKVLNYINKSDEKELYQNEYNRIYEEIAKTESALGNFKKAYRYSLLNKEISDKLLNEEKINRINELQTKFEVSEKENALKKSVLINVNQNNKIEKQRSYIYFGSFLFIIVVIILFLLSRIFYIKNIKNKDLEEQKLIADKINFELTKSQVKLNENLAEKELLLREIHHRVKNNLQLVISLLNIQAAQKENTSIDIFLEKSLSRITSMALIHQNLYLNENIGKVNFNEYLNILTESILNSFSNATQKIKVSIKIKDIFLEIENAISLGLIINELFYNAFKHAFPNNMKGKIIIEILKSTVGYVLIFKDNGVGFSKDLLEKDTLGIKLIKLLSQQLNGAVVIDSSVGTIFKINFSGKKID